MNVTRHYLTINGRKVHYRLAGKGPPLLMVHQSPRSSAEYTELMTIWGQHFTCIAPDTPGFGQSDPLPQANPDINDYADAIVDFGRALGLQKTAAYGFHSGGIILVTAVKRHPGMFHGMAVGGYAIWTPEEMAIFGESYIPPFRPSAYGEHLTWLWNRILEQSWFFPWFDVRGETRLSLAHDDPALVHAIVREMLDSGDAYRLGYGAVLRAPRDIPPPDAITPPVLVIAYDGDPLQAHIDRLGNMPAGWEARKVATPADLHEACLLFLQRLPASACPALAQDGDAGFVHISTGAFDGSIHWQGIKGSRELTLHPPGRELDTGDLAIDLPGHGLSDGWRAAPPTDWQEWQAVIDEVRAILGATSTVFPELEKGDPERLFPDLSPDRFGNYLTKAWSIVRARHFFAPWYEANASNAIAFDQDIIAPEALASDHRALIRASAARAYHLALLQREGR
ncbi:MAG: alpha/beta hydrolase [Sphingomonadaceae bacterium]|nr:alpha/beta hydrolase [Sphingomonadaceae bacterium]